MKNNHPVECGLRTIFDLDVYTLGDVEDIGKFCDAKGIDSKITSPIISFAVSPELLRTEMADLEKKLANRVPGGIVVCANKFAAAYNNQTFGFHFSYFNNIFYADTEGEKLAHLGKIFSREAQAAYVAKKLSRTNYLLVLERFSTPSRREIETNMPLERDLFAIRSVFGDQLE